jgi:hypothetical protein
MVGNKELAKIAGVGIIGVGLYSMLVSSGEEGGTGFGAPGGFGGLAGGEGTGVPGAESSVSPAPIINFPSIPVFDPSAGGSIIDSGTVDPFIPSVAPSKKDAIVSATVAPKPVTSNGRNISSGIFGTTNPVSSIMPITDPVTSIGGGGAGAITGKSLGESFFGGAKKILSVKPQQTPTGAYTESRDIGPINLPVKRDYGASTIGTLKSPFPAPFKSGGTGGTTKKEVTVKASSAGLSAKAAREGKKVISVKRR